MTINELREECSRSETVTLHLAPPNGNGYTRRLDGARGPRGKIICGNNVRQVVRFRSSDVLRYLDREQKKAMRKET